jgi:lysophospholipase L1-like esterase
VGRRGTASIVLHQLAESWIQEARRQFPETARRIAGEKGVSFVDLSAVVADRESMLMKDREHFSDEGARVIADVLAAETRKFLHNRTIPLAIAKY